MIKQKNTAKIDGIYVIIIMRNVFYKLPLINLYRARPFQDNHLDWSCPNYKFYMHHQFLSPNWRNTREDH